MVNQEQIPLEVQKFVAEYFASADQLDILLLLHGREGEALTAQEVGQAVFTVPTAATLRLEELVAAGLAASNGAADPTYRYQPSSARVSQAVDALAAAYRRDRVAVIQLVFQKGTDPLRSFVDAFKLRRDE